MATVPKVAEGSCGALAAVPKAAAGKGNLEEAEGSGGVLAPKIAFADAPKAEGSAGALEMVAPNKGLGAGSPGAPKVGLAEGSPGALAPAPKVNGPDGPVCPAGAAAAPIPKKKQFYLSVYIVYILYIMHVYIYIADKTNKIGF